MQATLPRSLFITNPLTATFVGGRVGLENGKMRPSRAAFLVCFVSFFFGLAAQGQIAGELKGRVSDPSGNGIANAQVRLTETSTTIQQNTIATGSGDYVFINLKPGSYSLEVSARGFGRLARTGITICYWSNGQRQPCFARWQ